MPKEIRNVGASVRARLQNLSRETGQSFDLILTRYALERLLYRLSMSAYADRFVLKGAMLLTNWFTDPHRATRDIDLLGFGDPSPDAMIAVFREILAADVADGVEFDSNALRVDQIREELEYGGLRLRTTASISGARIAVIHDSHRSTIAAEGLRRIAAMYAIEKEIRGEPAEVRLAVRQARTAPLVEDFGAWLRRQRARISPKSRLGEKLAYIGNHWDGLQVFLTDGGVEMDTNIVENAIRPLALNRKNALFAGHDEGAAAWGRIASLIETAKMNGGQPACLPQGDARSHRQWPSGLRDRSAAALGLYANLTLKARWCRGTAYTQTWRRAGAARGHSLGSWKTRLMGRFTASGRRRVSRVFFRFGVASTMFVTW